MSQPTDQVSDVNFISDERFMDHLTWLLNTRNFLLDNGSTFNERDREILNVNGLRMLRKPKDEIEKKQVRSPTPVEWSELENARITLAKYLTAETNKLISNDQFIAILNQFISTRNFLLDNGASFDAEDQEILKIGHLRMLRTPKDDIERRRARPPTPDEWNKLETARLMLAKYLTAETNHVISNDQFMGSLSELISSRNFLIDNGSPPSDQDREVLKLSELRMLRAPKEDSEKKQARPPTPGEWDKLETARLTLAKYNTPEMRRLQAENTRLQHAQKARMVIGNTPNYCLAAVLLGFACAIVANSPYKEMLDESQLQSSTLRLAGYVIWTLALGALGSAAFLGVSSVGSE